MKYLPIPRAELIGEKFGMLTVVGDAGPSPNKEGARWRCLCDCGKDRFVTTKKLRSGETQSCGCVKRRSDGGKAFRARQKLAQEPVVTANQAFSDLRAVFAAPVREDSKASQ